jgi:hypothetical protein
MPSPARIPQPDVRSYVDRIREHVEREEVGAARRLVAEALREGSTEPGLADWERLLAPGKVLGFSPASEFDRSAEFRWFAEHGREYRGQWVAVLGEQMLAHAKVYEDLRAELDKLRPAAPPFVHFVE